MNEILSILSTKEEAEQIKRPVADDVLCLLNEDQLWAIYFALSRASKGLIKELGEANKVLTKQFYDYGKKTFNWV